MIIDQCLDRSHELSCVWLLHAYLLLFESSFRTQFNIRSFDRIGDLILLIKKKKEDIEDGSDTVEEGMEWSEAQQYYKYPKLSQFSFYELQQNKAQKTIFQYGDSRFRQQLWPRHEGIQVGFDRVIIEWWTSRMKTISNMNDWVVCHDMSF